MIGTPAAPAASPSQDPNAQPSQPSQDPNAEATATVTDTVRADEQDRRALAREVGPEVRARGRALGGDRGAARLDSLQRLLATFA